MSCGFEDVGDIEDAVHAADPTPADRIRKPLLFPKTFRKAGAGDEASAEQVSGPMRSAVPGTETIFVKTWGCSHNNSDGEYMAGLLASYGYTVTTTDDKSAHLWVLNSCTVKTPSEDTFNNTIAKAKELGKHVVVAGCVPQAQPNGKAMESLSIVGVQQIDRVVEVVEETLKGHTVRLLGQKKEGSKRLGGASLNLPKIRKNPLIEIIAINTGCLNQCTYCKTKHARGDLASYPEHELVDRVTTVLDEGVVEFWLTSEDTGTYGRDIGTSLPSLLWKIIAALPDGVMLRLGMTNPPYILEHIDEIAQIMSHPRVYAFLHIPIQAASDAVLTTMRREYTCDDFCTVVDVLRAKVPGVTIATDIICGFPGETDEDFQETVKLIEKYKFPVLFINQFYARPGTPAELMTRVNPQVAKQRTKLLSDMFRAHHPYENRVGQVYKVLVTEDSSDGKHYVAHNKFYEQILIERKEEYLGRMIDVRIVHTSKFSMEGEVIEESLSTAPPRRAIKTPQLLIDPRSHAKVTKHSRSCNDDEDHAEDEHEHGHSHAPSLTTLSKKPLFSTNAAQSSTAARTGLRRFTPMQLLVIALTVVLLADGLRLLIRFSRAISKTDTPSDEL